MLLLITGHQRSGTSVLQKICNTHSAIRITPEFGNCARLGKTSYLKHTAQVLRRWRIIQGSWLIDGFTEQHRRKRWMNLVFVTRYLLALYKQWPAPMNTLAIETTLHRIFPDSQIVGDKWPYYLFILDRLIPRENLYFLIIYRDCRDVTSSTLKKVRERWYKQAWSANIDTAEKVAKLWVRTIELMEHWKESVYGDKIHILRYENLIWEPEQEMARLGSWLGVDPSGFSYPFISDTSIEKYRTGLTEEELAAVIEIAGPTMKRLGYE